MKVTPFAAEAASGGVEDVRGEHTEDRYAEASRFRVYEPMLIPGPLQHPDYAEAVQDFWAGHLRPDDGEDQRARSVAEAAAGQQRRAVRALDATFEVVLEEAALRTAIGGSRVLEAALRHLLELCRDVPRLELYVIPAGQGRDVPPVAPFWILGDSLVTSSLATSEVPAASLSWDDPQVIAAHEALFRQLQGRAVRGYTALRLVMDAREWASRG